jgi:hypothetical protein
MAKAELTLVSWTSTVCVFDPARLSHRRSDTADWWSVPDDELYEMNAGNVLFVDVGTDEAIAIEVEICESQEPLAGQGITGRVGVETGRLFIGPGEDVVGGDLEPDLAHSSGRYYSVDSGVYDVVFVRSAIDRLRIIVNPSREEARNSFQEPLEL